MYIYIYMNVEDYDAMAFRATKALESFIKNISVCDENFEEKILY